MSLCGGLTVMLGLSAGCSDASPTGPAPILNPELAEALVPSLEDAAIRLLPGILDGAVAAELAGRLDAIEAALADGDGGRAGEHVKSAARLLAEYSARGIGPDGPDVSAIRLMLAHLAVSVGAVLDASLIQ